MAPARKPPSTQLIAILVGGMLVTGCSNSLWSKWQDMQCVANCDAADPKQRHLFEQPVWQSATMFLGEIFCLLAFVAGESRFNPFRPKTRPTAAGSVPAHAGGERLPANARLATAPLSRPDESAFNFNESDISLLGDVPKDLDDGSDDGLGGGSGGKRDKALPAGPSWRKAALFTAPACCDIIGTSCMNVGLLFCDVSIYQMLRGALVLWVGVFSVLFLGRKLTRAQWLALATVMAGIAIVGASSLIGPKAPATVEDAPPAVEEARVSPLLGVGLVLIAQLFTASQFVIEERIMEKNAVEPLLAAGFEGTSGLAVTMVLLVIANALYGRTPAGKDGYFDMAAGWHQIVDNPPVWGSSIIIAISIALFNFTGLAVTKTVSATARSTIDSTRTLGIWAVSLYLGWESFKWLQVVGFVVLVYGTFVFNGITSFPEWLVAKPPIPAIVIPQESDDDYDEEDSIGSDEPPQGVESSDRPARATSVDSLGRPVTRRSGSGRRGEVSPLLKPAASD